MTASTIEIALGGYEPPDGTFSVGVVDHRGCGGSAVFPLDQAAVVFADLGNISDYETLAQATYKLLRTYKKKRREKDLKTLAMAGLATAIASPYCSFSAEFSAAVREHNRAAISLVFGKKRGLLVVVAERGFDDSAILKSGARAGLGPVAIFGAGKDGAIQ